MLEKRRTRMSVPRGLGGWTTAWMSLGSGLSRRWSLLNSEALCGEAIRRTRLENFGEPPIEPALSVLLNSLEVEADLHPMGRFLMQAHLRELLENRLRLAEAWNNKLEALEDSVIQRPVFITGMPRSGSTFLHELLAEDPESRVPRVWEVMFPVRNGQGNEMKKRVRKADACLWWFRRLAPQADAVYPLRAWTPHECVAIHSHTLISEEFSTICHVPTYEAFVKAADFGPTYSWQKRFLQYLQLCRPTRQWILKSPDHVHSLDSLLKIFPDAMIIQTHRNPFDVLKSAIKLTELLEGTFGRIEDRSKIAMRETRNLVEHMECITAYRRAHPELDRRFIDVKYHELVSDPLAVVRGIYQRLDLRLTERAAERMQRLASMRSRYKGRPTSPELADFEVEESVVGPRFEAYCSQFKIPWAA
ncbi:MAG: hypothetical protein QOI53_2564 [Verrucomicrobiota bacterium]|nr:hypothetical protein [Verrucomicrobiota bacterium]